MAGMSASLTCTFNSYTGILTVRNPVASTVTASAISFTVDSFLNPYNGKIVSGYVVATTDSAGGLIESSSVAGITLKIQMT